MIWLVFATLFSRKFSGGLLNPAHDHFADTSVSRGVIFGDAV
jgi:hypothetical protein